MIYSIKSVLAKAGLMCGSAILAFATFGGITSASAASPPAVEVSVDGCTASYSDDFKTGHGYCSNWIGTPTLTINCTGNQTYQAKFLQVGDESWNHLTCQGDAVLTLVRVAW
jgi:hypothetical protein